MNHPTILLDALMSEAIAKMSVISEVAGRSYDGSMVHGGEKDTSPRSLVEKPLVDFYRARYAGAMSDRARRLVVLDAVEDIRASKLGKKAPPIMGTVEWRVAIAHDPRPVKIVAYLYGCTERHVYRVRADPSVRGVA